MRSNSAPMISSTTRSGRSMKPTLHIGIVFSALSSCITHHHRSCHDDRRQHDVERSGLSCRSRPAGPSAAPSPSSGRERNRRIHRTSSPDWFPGLLSVHHVENAGAQNHNPAARNCPAASSTAATMLISNPINVRTLGWIFESASPRTIRTMTLLQAVPMPRVRVVMPYN